MDYFSDITVDYATRLLVATAVGGLIGLERELKAKPAGVRTNILMCLGSCLLMILSIETARRAGPPADPGRIAAQVVTGVGFLGAGTILRSRVSVAGLTSAATIWFVAALGLVIGSGEFGIAIAAAILMIVTLTLLSRLERNFEVIRQLHILELRVPREQLGKVRHAMYAGRITPDEVELDRKEGEIFMRLEYITRQSKHAAFIASVKEIPDIEIMVHY